MLFSQCLRHLFPCHKRGAVSYADVQSANICGYQTYNLVKGYNFFSPTFEGVGKTFNIQDMKLIGNVSGAGLDNICLLNENGQTIGSYQWWTAADIDDPSASEVDCWFDGNMWQPWDVDVNEGQGFYVYAAKDGVKIQCSGEVKLSPYTVNLNKGYNIVGNCSPVDVNIQAIKLSGAVSGAGLDNIVLINENGQTTGSYQWWTAADIDDPSASEVDCWFDGNMWQPWDVTIKAGEGLYLYAAKEGVILTIPCAVTK